ncbi:MAG: PH domain-containing protein [Spirochaetales bacterium]|nr:PH domain-containing protein [Spirochaetales bacterium]
MNGITVGIIFIIVTVVVAIIRISGRKKAIVTASGTMVMKYPVLVAIFGYIGIGFGLAAGIIAYSNIIPVTGTEAVPFLVLGFVLMGLPHVILQANVRVIVDEETIRYSGFLRKNREVRWEKILEVRFSFTSELVLYSDTTKIKINSIMKGYAAFIDRLKQKCVPALWEDAVKKSDRVTGI